MSKRVLHSVGIDIGTTTTQVIFSELELVNRAPASQVPHYEFARRDIIYVSPVIFTPLDDGERIRQNDLGAFIRSQYDAADLTVAGVESGAIIITGETLKAGNARATIMELAGTLGDFVVATAGPHLESIIAGHGSGAGEYARKTASRVLNIDIGGGTSNYAVFEAGRVVDTACLNVGGHLVETFGDGRIKTLHEPAFVICEALFGKRLDPAHMDSRQRDALIEKMAELIMEVVRGTPSDLAAALLMTDCLRPGQTFDTVFISGGVGALGSGASLFSSVRQTVGTAKPASQLSTVQKEVKLLQSEQKLGNEQITLKNANERLGVIDTRTNEIKSQLGDQELNLTPEQKTTLKEEVTALENERATLETKTIPEAKANIETLAITAGKPYANKIESLKKDLDDVEVFTQTRTDKLTDADSRLTAAKGEFETVSKELQRKIGWVQPFGGVMNASSQMVGTYNQYRGTIGQAGKAAGDVSVQKHQMASSEAKDYMETFSETMKDALSTLKECLQTQNQARQAIYQNM